MLVRPFTSQVATAEPGTHTITDFYAPAAVVLLVQQFGVAFGALTFVRERALGTVELYQAGPVSAGADADRQVPRLPPRRRRGGGPAGRAARAACSTCRCKAAPVPSPSCSGWCCSARSASGFLISLVSRNDTQAVQYAMIVLLASLFFSGFFLATERLALPGPHHQLVAAGHVRDQPPARRDAPRHRPRPRHARRARRLRRRRGGAQLRRHTAPAVRD